MAREVAGCEWLTLGQALTAFVVNATGHQSQGHIRPLHHYVASRLVVEGGFHPDDITPRPPFEVVQRSGRSYLHHDAARGGAGEVTILGGLKTKNVDVVATKRNLGPVLAVSMKGTLNAFRNLTNRMEEAVGDCTNLHLSYPILVYGFLHVISANQAANTTDPNDVCVLTDGRIVDSITRYHDILVRLDGRRDLRDDSTLYEAVGLALVQPEEPSRGSVLPTFPPTTSPLLLATFFDKLYRAYDLRFGYAAPKLEPITARLAWEASSPAFQGGPNLDYLPRLAGNA